jgi:hypothetical protein
VLNSAIALVAAAHKLSVRLCNREGARLEPWDASRLLSLALSEEAPTSFPDLIIARDEVTAKKLAQLLGRVVSATR